MAKKAAKTTTKPRKPKTVTRYAWTFVRDEYERHTVVTKTEHIVSAIARYADVVADDGEHVEMDELSITFHGAVEVEL